MSEQEVIQSSTKQRRNRKINIAKQENGKHTPTAQYPANDDTEAWKVYWKTQGQPWRSEPEISKERQELLAEQRKIKPDAYQGIYPFRDINPKLTCADIEWLLATHDNNRGPVDWNDESQREHKGLDLSGAGLRDVYLRRLPLAKCVLSYANLEGADLRNAHLEGAYLEDAHLEGAYLIDAHLESAGFQGAHLEGAILSVAHLEKAFLYEAHLEGAILHYANLEGADLRNAHLEGAYLSAAFFDRATNLEGIVLSKNERDAASLCDIHWGDVNVAVVDWSTISRLGDEKKPKGNKRIFQYEPVVRAYRQLSVVLRNQGINEHAARFSYRAQLMQRKVFWHDRAYAKWLGSLFIDLLSGYGYKPLRCFAAYLLVILTFAITYFIIGHKVGPVLSPLGSVIFSMTSFHGRGFFPGGIGLDDPLTVVAALEAFIGLLIEVTFIATLTQRLFGR